MSPAKLSLRRRIARGAEAALAAGVVWGVRVRGLHPRLLASAALAAKSDAAKYAA